MTAKEERKAAAEFAAKWAGKGYEKGECQKYWRSLLHDVFGISDPDDWVQYELQVDTGFSKRFIDAYIPRTSVLIEQKGYTKDLTDKQVIEQALLYVGALPDTMPVRFVVLCNFQEFIILDKHAAKLTPVKVALKDLPKKLRLLSFLTETDAPVAVVKDVAAVDKKAGELVGRLYRALLASYTGDVDERLLASLNMLCVRLVFCAYAEDSGVFPKPGQFTDYMRRYDAEAFRDRLAQLFRILNTDYPDRDPDDIPALLDFPYVGSGLFDDEHIRIPRFTEETRSLLLDSMCAELDWTEINPTIFGAVFESTLSTVMRRKNGMHYTTVKNIHRVADPLFLEALEKELSEASSIGNLKKRGEALKAYQEKLGSLKFLDPACGSGNFLTETYLSLRRLENRAIMMRQQGQAELDLGDVIRVTIDQFYGIEVDGFAVSVAQAALWIAESQMMIETERILHRRFDYLPLRRYAHIVRGNALKMDWNSLLAEGERFDFILGNPPFIGARNKTREQAADIELIFKGWKNAGNLDYVTCWYKKCLDLAPRNECDPAPQCAFVSSNSICQGESVALLWNPLFSAGMTIDFAWRTFIWDSEASEKAHVHVVIVGFHTGGAGKAVKRLFDDDGRVTEAKHINGYLMDGPDVFIESRTTPICDVPGMGIGNKPIDGGNYLFTETERDEFLKKEPHAASYFRPWLGSDEFINGKRRFCLWLGDASPAEIRSMPECVKRVQAVHDFRLASKSEGTRKIADKPTRFHVENFPEGDYLLVPKVSSERRKYVPMGFLSANVLASDLVMIIPDANLYHFGVLTSSVHMAWMRVVAGRLEMRYRYSAAIVYNNFPWPDVDGDQQKKIEQTAQGILDARALYPDSSLADLYDDTFMPLELRKAHKANDAAVIAAYGFPKDITEPEIVSRLFSLYAKLTSPKR